MDEVFVLQHAKPETPGRIGDVLAANGVGLRTVQVFAGEPVPRALGDCIGLVVMGGPMGVYEHARYPFLRHELCLIEQTLRANRPLLGVCLGSQLLAAALGATVAPGHCKEIGWHEVRLSPGAAADHLWCGVDTSFTAFHWHGDVFDLPIGAESLGSSELTRHQLFRYGNNAYGLLCHLEITRQLVQGMVDTFGQEVRALGLEGRAIVDGCRDYLPRLEAISTTVFQRWAALLDREENGAHSRRR